MDLHSVASRSHLELAQDYGLVQFVQKVTSMCRDKVYFVTPDRLGEYVMMDYMQRKMRRSTS